MKFFTQHKNVSMGIVLTIVYFSIFLIQLSDYGINWDEPLHFARGQAYLNYFLSGKDDFSNLPLHNRSFRKSIYIIQDWDAKYWIDNDSGHPPLNGILSAVTNKIFFESLGIVSDINAYHIFEILAGAFLLFIIYLFAAENYGIMAGVIASLATFFYPLFLGEVHFNIKDPPEAAFYTFTIYAFFQGITKKSWKWILLSALGCGFALGTKLNVVFIPLILLPWLIVYLLSIRKKMKVSFLRSVMGVMLSLMAYPCIVLGIFIGTWPYLWHHTFSRMYAVIGYYHDIGTGNLYQPPAYYFLGWNTFPLQWIVFTTPVVTLFLTLIGCISAVFLCKTEVKKTSLLFLLWFLIPILRVSVPGSSLYGGDRQIMEFIPAMGLLSGVGAVTVLPFITRILNRFVSKQLAVVSSFLILCLLFLPVCIRLAQIHPNENVFFNFLIGGLKGAKQKNIPYWGISYGNVYLQGIHWINSHAEKNAQLSLINGTAINIPNTELRHDVVFNNNSWSGTFHHGEYNMDMMYQGFPGSYEWDYLNRYLYPIYEDKVDGVPILAIWKNDQAHTKPGFLHEDSNVTVTGVKQTDASVTITLDKKVYITKIDEWYKTENCTPLKSGYITISADGEIWYRQNEDIPTLQVTMDIEPKDKRMVYLFAAKPAKYIKIYADKTDSCILNPQQITVSKLTDLQP